MNHPLAASGRWMASLAQLLRPRRSGSAGETASVTSLPIRIPSGMPVRQAIRPTRAATARPIGAHVSRRTLCSPLRVVRIVEAGQASALSGRILMSGRMADVCAELDRMVEREAAMQPGR